MANDKRPPLLGKPRWDTENRAVAHLLFVLFDLWPDHGDDLINIFHRMFPHFQRIRFTIYHLRDMWQARFGADRNAYNNIDRPNERDHRPSTQAQLNDFATLNSIIHRWATSLGITLRPQVPAMNHRYGGGTYDFFNGVADPNDNLTTYVNGSTGARSALRPGDAIPQRLIDLMTVGVSDDKKLKFGMPVDGLPNLPMTIGFDVDEDGNWLPGAGPPPPPAVQQQPTAQPQPAPQPPATVPTQAASQPAQQPSQKQLPGQGKNVVDLTADSDDDDDAPVTRTSRPSKRGRPGRRGRRVYYSDEDDEPESEPEDDDDEEEEEEEEDDSFAPAGKRARRAASAPKPQPKPARGRPPKSKPQATLQLTTTSSWKDRVGVAPEEAHLLPPEQVEMYRKGLTLDGRPLKPMQSGPIRNTNSVPVPFSRNYTRYTTTPNDDLPLFSDALEPPEEDIPASHISDHENEDDEPEASDPEEVDGQDDEEAGLPESDIDEESEAEAEEDDEDLYAPGTN